MKIKNLVIFLIKEKTSDYKILKDALELINQFEITLSVFTDIDKGFKELERKPVDVIFLNLHFENTLDIIRKIRNAGDFRPIIILIDKNHEQKAIDLLNQGADDYLIGTELNPDILRRSIDSVITKFHLIKEKEILAEELVQSKKMEAIGQLAGGLAHDFNNMLMGIIGFTDLAILKSQGRDIQKDLQRIHEISQCMAELIDKLLSFSRRNELEKTIISLRQFIKEMEIIITHTIPKNIELFIDLANEPLNIIANSAMLHNIILNLSLNAVDAMPDGGLLTIHSDLFEIDEQSVNLHANLEIGQYILLEIQDTGSGILQENIGRIFEPFFTTKKLSSDKGTGLGLTIVWQNVKELGGIIRVYSELNKGTSFRIYFPTPKFTKQSDFSRKSSIVNGGSETILIVDDEKIILDFASEMLKRLGYNVYISPSAKDAIETFKNYHGEIDLIILDASLPFTSGEDCIPKLIETDKDVKILISSGFDLKSDEQKFLIKGTMGVIQKPFQLRELAKKIRTIIDSKI